MKAINGFLNLFHRKQRFSPQYQTLSWLKKVMFFGAGGFMISLSISKFIQSSLIYAFEPTQQNKLLIKLNPALDRSVYQPTILMIFGIFQRMYAKYRQQEPYLRIEQQQFDEQTLHWVTLHDKATHNVKSNKKNQIPVVVVFAGSQGLDNTARHLMLAAYTLGYRTVAIDPKDFYDQQKIHRIMVHIQKQYPLSKIMGIGIQYGANLLINYAANHPKQLTALISIGNPFDLFKSEANLQNSWFWRELYNSMLKGKIQKGKKINKKLDQKNISSLFELDKFVYNIDDDKYLQWKIKNSCINSISKLQQPTLFLQSKEDPFTQPIENDDRFQNQKCIYVTTQRGGHNQWFQNIWMNRWLISPVKYFLKLNCEERVKKIQESEKKRVQDELTTKRATV